MFSISRFFNKKLFKKKDGLSFRRRRRKLDRDRIGYVLVLVLELVIVIGLAYGTVFAFGKQVECSNASMEPTYKTADKLLVNIVAFKFSKPERGDVIAFKPKANVNAGYSVKRVIGLPGDEVQIKNGRIYINGEVYKESIDLDSIDNPGMASSPVKVLKNHYFVLGDNRNSSEDSRYGSIGVVSIDSILGKVWGKFPF